jgi:hypothetical protein
MHPSAQAGENKKWVEGFASSSLGENRATLPSSKDRSDEAMAASTRSYGLGRPAWAACRQAPPFERFPVQRFDCQCENG